MTQEDILLARQIWKDRNDQLDKHHRGHFAELSYLNHSNNNNPANSQRLAPIDLEPYKPHRPDRIDTMRNLWLWCWGCKFHGGTVHQFRYRWHNIFQLDMDFHITFLCDCRNLTCYHPEVRNAHYYISVGIQIQHRGFPRASSQNWCVVFQVIDLRRYDNGRRGIVFEKVKDQDDPGLYFFFWFKMH